MVFDIGYLIITGVAGLVGGLVGQILKKKMTKYANVPVRSGLSGKEVAKKMLDHYGIYDVQIVEGQGFLTDHYNPGAKVISLSPAIYRGQTIAAAAVAAHECGHAVQHAEAYAPLKMRSAIVPLVSFSAKMQQFLVMGAAFIGAGAASSSAGNMLLLALVAVFGITALFSIITLPVEFDASARALNWLDETGTLEGEEYKGAKDGLKWAAMTYVASALSAIVMVLYFLMKLRASQRR